MHRFVFTFLLCFAACGSLLAVEAVPAPEHQKSAATTDAAPANVESWRTDKAAHSLVGEQLPAFSLSKVAGGKISQEELRGRWTIIGFWNATVAGIEDETRYLRALNSAVDQDPDLDLLTIYLRLDAAETNVARWFANNGGNPWPTLIDKSDTGATFSVTTPPAYLLVGPDLTVRAARGPLAADPDGIKSTIRGVAEIRTTAPR